MTKKAYQAPAIIEAAQFERRTLLTGCTKTAGGTCGSQKQLISGQCNNQSLFNPGPHQSCQNANNISFES